MVSQFGSDARLRNSIECLSAKVNFHCFAGKIVEYDEPMKLMKKESSLFGQLVKEYWSHLQSAESH